MRAVTMPRHGDHHTSLPAHSADIEFLWRPYPSNMTQEVEGWTCESATRTNGLNSDSRRAPGVLVAGSLLWHVLHGTDAAEFERELFKYGRAVDRLLERCQSVRFIWAQMNRVALLVHKPTWALQLVPEQIPVQRGAERIPQG